MKQKKIEIPIYYGELIIVQVKDLAKLPKKFKQDVKNSYAAITFSHHKKSGRTRYVIAFGGKASPSAVAHECTHFVNWVFFDRKVDLDLLNDEPQAYLLGWAVGEATKFLKMQKP
jgi:hypothetical protein